MVDCREWYAGTSGNLKQITRADFCDTFQYPSIQRIEQPECLEELLVVVVEAHEFSFEQVDQPRWKVLGIYLGFTKNWEGISSYAISVTLGTMHG